ncbi:hypothetical protein GCM10011318_04790 [Phaeocystidibacter marisrubri]|nr:hypothetical protein GCM10011318_04790 [Phaeocystidibacter marisrubri]
MSCGFRKNENNSSINAESKILHYIGEFQRLNTSYCAVHISFSEGNVDQIITTDIDDEFTLKVIRGSSNQYDEFISVRNRKIKRVLKEFIDSVENNSTLSAIDRNDLVNPSIDWIEVYNAETDKKYYVEITSGDFHNSVFEEVFRQISPLLLQAEIAHNAIDGSSTYQLDYPVEEVVLLAFLNYSQYPGTFIYPSSVND